MSFGGNNVITFITNKQDSFGAPLEKGENQMDIDNNNNSLNEAINM